MMIVSYHSAHQAEAEGFSDMQPHKVGALIK
jgi:hypothetical protein